MQQTFEFDRNKSVEIKIKSVEILSPHHPLTWQKHCFAFAKFYGRFSSPKHESLNFHLSTGESCTDKIDLAGCLDHEAYGDC